MLPIKASMDHNDPHFRYKMPMIASKIEGKGNGIKTVCTNIILLAKSLDRPAAYLLKYFGTELGANVKIVKDIYIINGQHDSDKLLTLLYSFIKRFVLCTKCSNPETILSVNKKVIDQKCLACGHATTLAKTHKLCTYIMNHPPDGSVVVKTSRKGKSKSSPGKSGNDSGNDHNNSNNSGDEEGGDSDEFDDEELTPEAYSERMRELCEGLNSDVYLSDPKESANAFFLLLKEKIASGQIHDSGVHKYLHSEAVRLNIKDKAPLILSELLFTTDMLDQIKTHRLLFLRFTHENLKAQKYLIAGFEKLVGVYEKELMGKVCLILKAFYDGDLLEEEAILEWAKKVSKKNVSREVAREIHERAEPLVRWLKEAEEESGEEDEKEKEVSGGSDEGDSDDDDGVDFEFSHRATGGMIQEVKVVERKVVVVDGEDLDDLIDEI